MSENMSVATAEILEGLNEALLDAQGIPVAGVKRSVVHHIKTKEVVVVHDKNKKS